MSKKSGAWLVRHALEQLPISYTFGIPGVHNTEIYDELNKSEKIRPVLVTHEGGASFIADAISRTSQGEIGCLMIVPAAGLTHAMSGIGEAYLDGIPMLIITGGTRTDVEFGYQLHELDQQQVLAGISKGAWKVETHADIVPTIFKAYDTAVSGLPGPVLVEIPVNIQLFQNQVDALPVYKAPVLPPLAESAAIAQAVELLANAKRPGLFVGWGAVDVSDEVRQIAELLGAPVATTLQGMSSFPGDHRLHAGMGFSNAAVPAARNAFKDADALLAIGTRFGEIPTGSFGVQVPDNLIHIDIDPNAIGRNYKAKIGIAADARVAVPALLAALKAKGIDHSARREQMAAQIAADKAAYRHEWYAHRNDRVNPAMFFDELRKQMHDDAMLFNCDY